MHSGDKHNSFNVTEIKKYTNTLGSFLIDIVKLFMSVCEFILNIRCYKVSFQSLGGRLQHQVILYFREISNPSYQQRKMHITYKIA